jgi:hypothetical protein
MHLIDPFDAIELYSYLYVIKPITQEENDWDEALEEISGKIEKLQESVAESREF